MIKGNKIIVTEETLTKTGETLTKTQESIVEVLEEIKDTLIEKNRRYGDSALSPANIFSKVEAEEAICIRLDDKIKRITNSQEVRQNDAMDIIGYLVLLAVAKKRKNEWGDARELID